MKPCYECGHDVPDDTRVCPNCGHAPIHEDVLASLISNLPALRSLVADRYTETGVTSDGQMVHFNRSTWSWLNDDTYARVEIPGGITWIDLDTE